MSSDSAASRATSRYADLLSAIRTLTVEVDAEIDARALLRHTLDRAIHLLDADRGGLIGLYDQDATRLWFLEAAGPLALLLNQPLVPAPSLVEQLASAQGHLIIPDYDAWPDRCDALVGQGVGAMLAVPLRWQGQTIGVLAVNADPQRRVFGQDDVWVAEMLVAYAAATLGSARLIERMQALNRASQKLISAAKPEDVLRAVADLAFENGAHLALLYYVDYDADGQPRWARTVAAVQPAGQPEVVLGARYQLSDEALSRAMMADPSRLQIVEDTARSPLVEEQTAPLLNKFGIRAALSGPLIVGGRWVGAINLNWPTPRRFSEDELRFYRLMLPQAAAVVENHRLLEETRQAQERFQQVALSASDWVWEIDAQGRITYCSEYTGAGFGLSPAEIVGHELFDLLAAVATEANLARLRSMWETWLADQKPITDLEVNVHPKGAASLWFLINAMPVFDAAHSLIGFRGVVKDITLQKEDERREQLAREVGQQITAMLSLEDLLAAIISQVQEKLGFYHVHVRLYDPASGDLVLREGAGEAGERLKQAVSRIPLSADPSLVALAARTFQPVVVNDVRQDPHHLPNPLLPLTRSEAAFPLFWGENLLGVLDVQAEELGRFSQAEVHTLQNLAVQLSIALENAQLYQKLQQQAAHLEELVAERTVEIGQERERLKAIVESAGEGIVITALDGTIEYVNPAWERIVGVPAAQAVGRQTAEVYSGSAFDQVEEMLAALHSGQVWQSEAHLSRPDGSEYDASFTVAPVANAHGELITLVSVVRDVTTLKELNRIREDFVANVSHELRTPIANLKLYHTLVRTGRTDKREVYLDSLGEQIDRLERLVNDLLDLSRLDRRVLPLTPEHFNLNDLVGDVVRTHLIRIGQRDLHLTVDLSPDVSDIYADRERIGQVLVNLLMNAVNYTPPGGHITVRTGRTSQDLGPRVLLSVEDTGIGISAKELPFIFNRFFRAENARLAKVPGSGLGLSIVKEIVDLHGGKIEVTSTVGQGTTFTVSLPRGEGL